MVIATILFSYDTMAEKKNICHSEQYVFNKYSRSHDFNTPNSFS